MNRTKKYLLFGVIFLAVFGLAYHAVFDAKLDLNGDNAQYLTLARHMVAGQGYTMVNTQGELTPANQYPPGYSAVLAAFMAVGVDNVVFFKLLNGLFMLIGVLLLCYWMSRLSGNDWLGLAVGVGLALSVPMLHFASMVMSEMAYMLLSSLAFFCLYKYAQEKQEGSWLRNPWFYLAFVCAALAYYFRTMALSIVFALLVFYLFRKEWKQALVSLGGMVLINLPWVIRNSVTGVKSRYFGTIMTVNPWRPEAGTISSVGEFVEKLLNNFDETVIKAFKESLFPFMDIQYAQPSSFMAVVGGLLVLAVIVYGCWNFKSLRWLLIAYFVGNIGLFALWHGGNGIRYVVPLIPWVVGCFYMGVWSLVKLVWKQAPDALVLLFALLSLTSVPKIKEQSKLAAMPYPPAYKVYFDIARGMQADSRYHGKVVACRKPELFMLYAFDVYPVHYLFSSVPEEVIQDMLDHNITYVILDALGYSSTGLYLYPAVQKYQQLFAVEYACQNPYTYLLRLDREQAAAVLAQGQAIGE